MENINGYFLKTDKDLYTLQYGDNKYSGDLRDTVHFAVKKLGFDFKELEIGLLEMERNGHNTAHFGTFKSFMWSYNQ